MFGRIFVKTLPSRPYRLMMKSLRGITPELEQMSFTPEARFESPSSYFLEKEVLGQFRFLLP